MNNAAANGQSYPNPVPINSMNVRPMYSMSMMKKKKPEDVPIESLIMPGGKNQQERRARQLERRLNPRAADEAFMERLNGQAMVVVGEGESKECSGVGIPGVGSQPDRESNLLQPTDGMAANREGDRHSFVRTSDPIAAAGLGNRWNCSMARDIEKEKVKAKGRVDEQLTEEEDDCPNLADSDDEETIPNTPNRYLSPKQRERREHRQERERMEAEAVYNRDSNASREEI